MIQNVVSWARLIVLAGLIGSCGSTSSNATSYQLTILQNSAPCLVSASPTATATETVQGSTVLTYPTSTVVTLTVDPSPPDAFISWVDASGAAVSTTNPTSITVTNNVTIQAVCGAGGTSSTTGSMTTSTTSSTTGGNGSTVNTTSTTGSASTSSGGVSSSSNSSGGASGGASGLSSNVSGGSVSGGNSVSSGGSGGF